MASQPQQPLFKRMYIQIVCPTRIPNPKSIMVVLCETASPRQNSTAYFASCTGMHIQVKLAAASAYERRKVPSRGFAAMFL